MSVVREGAFAERRAGAERACGARGRGVRSVTVARTALGERCRPCQSGINCTLNRVGRRDPWPILGGRWRGRCSSRRHRLGNRRVSGIVGKLVTRRSFLGPEPRPALSMRWATGAPPQSLQPPTKRLLSLMTTSYFSRAVRGYKSGLVRPAANQTKPASGATSGSAGVVRNPGSGSARCLRVKRRKSLHYVQPRCT